MQRGTPLHGVRVVVLGGGTGTFTVLSALKHYVEHLTAVVNMVDDGGSTGVLRDELGVLPPGDVRQALVALSLETEIMRELMNYRFDAGSLEGHSFGNFLLTALEKITGSFDEAVEVAGKVLAVKGAVVPVTTEDVRLSLRTPDGSVVRGERQITQYQAEQAGGLDLFLEPEAKISARAADAIVDADLLVMAPGSLYSSLLPIALVGGVPEALRASRARKVFVANLMTRPGQTDGFLAHQFLDELERVTGPVFDYLLYNTQPPGGAILARYGEAGEQPVGWDRDAMRDRHYAAVGAELLSDDHDHQRPGDALKRTLIRHDSDRLARVLMRLYFT